MDESTREVLLAEYDSAISRYDELANVTRDLIAKLLAYHGISVHSVQSRTKTRSSLARKIAKKGRGYTSLAQITDVAGVRITTYFEPDVRAVAAIVEDEFDVDWANSIDKQAVLDPDRFGYLSVHYVASMSRERCQLAEYSPYSGMSLEIQVRSILQHAWAEIEHDLGYKSEQSIPKPIRRRFSRVAGLLELADAEFAAIRTDLQQYEAAVPGRIATEPERVTIDKVSISAFVASSPTVRRIDGIFATAVRGKVGRKLSSPEALVRRLQWFNFETIAEVERELDERETLIREFASRFELRRKFVYSEGISLRYLGYVLAAETESLVRIMAYLKVACGASGNIRKRAGRILGAYSAAKRALANPTPSD